MSRTEKCFKTKKLDTIKMALSDKSRSEEASDVRSPLSAASISAGNKTPSPICTICNKLFVNPSKLKQHMMIHTGEKSHICDICGRCFNQSSNMWKHRRSHNLKGPNRCEKCGKRFASRSLLNYHATVECGTSDKDISRAELIRKGLLRDPLLDSGSVRATDWIESISDPSTTTVVSRMLPCSKNLEATYNDSLSSLAHDNAILLDEETGETRIVGATAGGSVCDAEDTSPGPATDNDCEFANTVFCANEKVSPVVETLKNTTVANEAVEIADLQPLFSASVVDNVLAVEERKTAGEGDNFRSPSSFFQSRIRESASNFPLQPSSSQENSVFVDECRSKPSEQRISCGRKRLMCCVSSSPAHMKHSKVELDTPRQSDENIVTMRESCDTNFPMKKSIEKDTSTTEPAENIVPLFSLPLTDVQIVRPPTKKKHKTYRPRKQLVKDLPQASDDASNAEMQAVYAYLTPGSCEDSLQTFVENFSKELAVSSSQASEGFLDSNDQCDDVYATLMPISDTVFNEGSHRVFDLQSIEEISSAPAGTYFLLPTNDVSAYETYSESQDDNLPQFSQAFGEQSGMNILDCYDSQPRG